MASEERQPDALLLLRAAQAASKPPLLTSTADPSQPEDVADVVQATHLQFTHADRITLSLDTRTRFKQYDLRSIYVAFQQKDAPFTIYLTALQKLNQELKAAGREALANLSFVEKTDFTAWLEGSHDDSEFIEPLGAEEQARQTAAAIGASAGVPAVLSAGQAGGARHVDPRLQEIYNGERKMGDRNTVLRGIKPMDFSSVHKYAEDIIRRNKDKKQPAQQARVMTNGPAGTPALASRGKPTRRVEPIILVSPSASSLLRLSNIKSFLDEGLFMPPEMGSTEANRLQITRLLPDIDPQRPLRFILVDSPEMFKPDYWSRVAAVFTTGQTWQFKSYKWQSPPDLFSHALGIYVGWRGEQIPSVVQGWGRGVVKIEIDKYQGTGQNRWRDREEVEKIWSEIQRSMVAKGMNKDGALTGAR